MFLGIDIGTSSIKAVLLDEQERLAGSATAALEVKRPHPGWSEQDPTSWIEATRTTLARLKEAHGRELAAVRAVGLSGQMHGATLLDESDRPLRPCILWNDGRSGQEAAELDADPRFRALTGNIVFPGFTAPKLVWVARHEPEHFRAVRKVLLPKDYVRLWLTGEHVSEMSDAAGTAWLDVAARAWSSELLEATGMGIAQMPRLEEGSAVAGNLRSEIQALLGVERPVPVAGGGADNAAAAVGMGIWRPGSAFVSLGTSGVLLAASDGFRPNASSAVHAFCHALPGAWYQMGVILSATDSLEWLARVTGADAATLTDELGEALRAPAPVSFLPYLSGERTPHNDTLIRGVLAGLDHASDRKMLTQAVLEGVAFAFKDCQHALLKAGTSLDRAIAVGGGSKSRYWLKVIATALGIPIDLPADGDVGAALGAARLARLAAGGAVDEVLQPPALASTIEPDARLRAEFDEAHEKWRRLYPAIKGANA